MPHGRAKGLRQRGRLAIYAHQSDSLYPGIPKLEQSPSVGSEVLLSFDQSMAPELVPQTLEDSGGSAGGPGCAGFQYTFLNSRPDRPSQIPRGGGILCLYEAPTHSAEGVLGTGSSGAGSVVPGVICKRVAPSHRVMTEVRVLGQLLAQSTGSFV